MKLLRYIGAGFAALSLLVAGCATTEHAYKPAKNASGNPFLYQGSALAINHWDPEQSDASTLAFPTGDVKSENLDVQFIPGNVLGWTLGHAPTSGGPEIGWFSGAQLIGKVRLDGGRFELIDTFTVPGFEHLADTPALAKQLVEKLDATRDETVFVDTLMDAIKRTRAEAWFNGIYSLVDKEGYYFTVYGTTVYKFGHQAPNDPLSGIKVVASLDMKTTLPPEQAKGLKSLVGVNITGDGHLVVVMGGAIVVVTRDLANPKLVTIPGEAIENNVTADADNGIYVVTTKNMHKLVWTGKTLSSDPKDGAWVSPYDVSSEPIPGAVSRGSGTTPTIIGTGPGQDKLVVIANYGTPVKAVAFWADDIPSDFKRKPGSKSRRIADQIAVRVDAAGTMESSFIGYGDGFVAMNQTPPKPIMKEAPSRRAFLCSVGTMGGTRPAAKGLEKFVWNKQERKLESAWLNKETPMLVTVATYNRPTNRIYIEGAEKGVFGLYQIDWDTGKQVGRIELGRSHKFNVSAGPVIPLSDGRIWLTGMYGPVLVKVK